MESNPMSPATVSPLITAPTHPENSTPNTSVLFRNVPQCAVDAKVDRIRKAMVERSNQGLRRVGIHVDGALIRLTGRVSSYHQKQLATAVVLSLDGVERLENDLQVCR